MNLFPPKYKLDPAESSKGRSPLSYLNDGMRACVRVPVRGIPLHLFHFP